MLANESGFSYASPSLVIKFTTTSLNIMHLFSLLMFLKMLVTLVLDMLSGHISCLHHCKTDYPTSWSTLVDNGILQDSRN